MTSAATPASLRPLAVPVPGDLLNESRQAQAVPRDNERRLRQLLEVLPVALYTTDAQGRITFYNEAAAEFWGQRPELGTSEWCGSWRLYRPDGTPLPHDQCPMAQALRERRPIRDVEAIAERPDGTRVPFIPYPTPLYDDAGALLGAVNVLIDITRLKEAEERQQLLINELNHRVKNTLATVQSIASQTFRGKTDMRLQQRFEGRLIALAKTHDVLTRENWQDADLHDTIRQAVDFACDTEQKVDIAGPPVRLPPRIIVPLAMALHELCTNASKYGALSNPDGRVDIHWQVSPGHDRLSLRWVELGGPAVAPPKMQGFGSRLLERGLAHELQAQVQLEYPPSGVICTIELALPRAHVSS